jgi:hypothetical protein
LDVIHSAITLLHVETSKITREVICSAGIHVPDWRVIVVAGRSRIPGALIVVVVGLELGVVTVPAV